MTLDVWVNSSIVSPVFVDPESINFIDYWESGSQCIPQISSYHNGQANADSTANGVGTCTISSVATSAADSNANGITGISATATSAGDSTANVIGFASKTHNLNYWISSPQSSPSYVKINYFEYWSNTNNNDPQLSGTEPSLIIYNYVIMI